MSKLFVANWKMQLTHNESLTWINNNLADLEIALAQTNNKLVICPSFTVLSHVSSLNTQSVSFGGQDCSFEPKGAYTGDVSATSLKELNCRYCIVGHSERRLYYHETNEMVAQKALQLINVGIEPIICIGETAQERAEGKTELVLERQLKALLNNHKTSPVTFAYEPIWAISTMHVPKEEHSSIITNKSFDQINKTIAWIRSYLSQNFGSSQKLLYGGNVNHETADIIKILPVDGYLIGKASINATFIKTICSH